MSSDADEFSDFMKDEVANKAALATEENTGKAVLSNPDKASNKADASTLSTQRTDAGDAKKVNIESAPLMSSEPAKGTGKGAVQADQEAKDKAESWVYSVKAFINQWL